MNRRRLTELKKNRAGGFTLVEVVVTMLVMLIVVGLAMGFLISGGNFLSNAEREAADKTLAEDGADYARDRLLNARQVQVAYGGSLAEVQAVATDAAILYIGDESGERAAAVGRLYYILPGDEQPLDVLGSSRYGSTGLAMAYASEKRTRSGIDPEEALAEDMQKIFSLKMTTVRGGKPAFESEKTFRYTTTTSCYWKRNPIPKK